MKIITLSIFWCLCNNKLNALGLPGPLVYVVTPSSRSLTIDEGRSAPRPFYYHNWMRRMDSPNITTTTTTTTPKTKTPDLIFAEFESDHMKNIKKLLEKERTDRTTTTTTMKPIYVMDEEIHENSPNMMNEMPPSSTEKEEMKTKDETKDMTDYFALYNNLYGGNDNLPVPIYVPITSTQKTTTTTTTEAPTTFNSVENIWHIIDSEKQYSSSWDEVPVSFEKEGVVQDVKPEHEEKPDDGTEDEDSSFQLDDNFALPGFGTISTKGAENESRAIRTEPNMRFPYVNLKPFQMKNLKKPLPNSVSNSKKGNNMYTNLDNFFDVKHPVRGEAQDVVVPMRQPIDRYNPAQPYLPDYGTRNKQSNPISPPTKTVANLVPPPPPPKITADDFPPPVSYESFPPYAPSAPDSGPPSPPVPKPSFPMSSDIPASYSDDDSESGPGDTMDLGYRYKPPAQTAPPPFVPTVPTPVKPFKGYSYDKPMMMDDAPPPMATDDKPDFSGYHYDKPMMPEKPDFQGYSYKKPEPAIPEKPDYDYHYSKPEPPGPTKDHPPSYDHGPPSYDHGPAGHDDYPELIFDNHSGKGGKGGDDMKGDDMGMMPPPPPPDMKPGMDGPPMDDSGFPHDFPGDLKFHHFDDDHDFYHHHHHTTTTTTTTEMPRVNRYSYYYLGKKLYYLPLYFSVYFIIYVGALIIKAVLRHKIVYPNSYRPNDMTASFFSKRSVDSWNLSDENLHEITGKVTHAIASAAERYMKNKDSKSD